MFFSHLRLLFAKLTFLPQSLKGEIFTELSGPATSPEGHSQTQENASSFVEEEEQPRLTTAEKLRAAQMEAEEASKNPKAPENEDHDFEKEMEDEIAKLRSPAKKSKIKGRPKRRKSTLSPEELENLLGLEWM